MPHVPRVLASCPRLMSHSFIRRSEQLVISGQGKIPRIFPPSLESWTDSDDDMTRYWLEVITKDNCI